MPNSEKSLSELNKRLKDLQSQIKDMKDKQQERLSSFQSKSDDDGEESSSSSPSTRKTKHKHTKKKKKHSRKRKSREEEEHPASVHEKGSLNRPCTSQDSKRKSNINGSSSSVNHPTMVYNLHGNTEIEAGNDSTLSNRNNNATSSKSGTPSQQKSYTNG
ncbi:uncharacterized protein [Clytia hemisphaerica]|uniref:uncharacterized protein n=1 Tax=Clytia hemisphaerica TaxID=252671 RepID=UPI0034D633C5